MATQDDVILDPSPEPVLEEDILVDPPLTPEPVPGSKTPPENLLGALKQEREEKATLAEELRIAKEELAVARNVLPPSQDEPWSDEGRVIVEKHVAPLVKKVEDLTEQLTFKDLIIKFPALKDKQAEFSAFRKTRPGYALDDAATLFLNDQGLINPPARRKGLEAPRGGERTPLAPATMTTAEIDELREKDYPRYQKLLLDGKIPLSGNSA